LSPRDSISAVSPLYDSDHASAAATAKQCRYFAGQIRCLRWRHDTSRFAVRCLPQRMPRRATGRLRPSLRAAVPPTRFGSSPTPGKASAIEEEHPEVALFNASTTLDPVPHRPLQSFIQCFAGGNATRNVADAPGALRAQRQRRHCGRRKDHSL